MTSVFASELILSANDKGRVYRHVTLANDLQLLLISDPTTEKAACCVDVRVGSLQDPPEAPGLAHFLEHLLFMGTEKHPSENAYSAYLNEHGGSSNAYTSMENTVYFFDVIADSLEETLDIFSSFFVCPLFAPSSTEREINAVDSENSKNLQSDGWRLMQLFKSMTLSDHPFNGFSTGNAKTLGKEPSRTRDLCIEFHKKYYSSNIMKAVILGKESLDVLQKWAEDKFSHVTNSRISPPSTPTRLFAEEGLAKIVSVVPIGEYKALSVYFPIPSISALYESKPTGYLTHLIGHEGGGSILSALKSFGLANGLSSYVTYETSSFANICVNVELTDQGVERYHEVLECLFSYIGILRREGTLEWIYEEIINTRAMDFRFLNACDPIDYVVDLANNMHDMKVQHCISGQKLVFSTDKDNDKDLTVAAFLDRLTPDNCITFLKHKGLVGRTDKKEEWYGTEYSDRPMTPAERHGLRDCMEGQSKQWSFLLALPQPNEFIPTDFNIFPHQVASPDCSGVPVLINETKLEISTITEQARAISEASLVSTDQIQVQEAEADEGDDSDSSPDTVVSAVPPVPSLTTSIWHLQDSTWNVPKVNCQVIIESPHAFTSPVAVACTELFANILKDVLSEFSYYADCAGLMYNLSATKGGLQVSFSGFHHKMPKLVERMADEMKKMCDGEGSLTEALFNRMKEKLMRSFANFKFWPPYFHAQVGAMLCCEEPKFSSTEKYLVLTHLSFNAFQAFCSLLLKPARTLILVHGNADNDAARQLGAIVTEKLNVSPLPDTQRIFRRCVDLQPNTHYIYRCSALLTNPEELNSCCNNIYYLPLTPSSLCPRDFVTAMMKARATVVLLAQILNEAAFDTLRTKEQLGYIVWTRPGWTCNHQQNLVITVQSSHKSPEYLDTRIEGFLREHYTDVVASMTPEQLAIHVQAVVEITLERPKNLDEETVRHWTEMTEGRYMFSSRSMLVVALKSLTLEDVKTSYSAFLLGETGVKTKFSSHYYGKGNEYPAVPTSSDGLPAVIITDTGRSKRTMPLQPFVDLQYIVSQLDQ